MQYMACEESHENFYFSKKFIVILLKDLLSLYSSGITGFNYHNR